MDASVRVELAEVKRKSWRLTLLLAWRTGLAFAALLDFLATVLPPLLRSRVGPEDGVLIEELWEEYEIFDHPIPDFPFGVVLKFLNRECGKIGFVFSILWFVEAFLDASRSREKTLLERDRKRLLSKAQAENDEDDYGQIAVIDDLGYLDDNYDSWFAFYIELFWQLMLLPTGFYQLVSQGLYKIALWDGEDDGMIERMLRDTYDIQELTGSFHIDRHKNMALGFTFLKTILDAILDFAHQQGILVKQMLVKEIVHLVRHTLTNAILHPRQFAKRIQNGLTALRWFKYIQPIFGASNKLKGNLQDLIKKHRQRQEYLLLQKTRRRLFHELTTKEQREIAARKIQSLFRSHQVRKRIRAMKILSAEKETLAAIRMQAVFRAKLEQARARIKMKRVELERLKAKAELDLWKKAEKKQTRMTPEERVRLYQLEEELHKESVKVLHRRMLLKPNTRFAVAWKLIFVFCVIFEITGLVVNPLLKKYKDERTHKSVTVDSAVKKLLLPVPTTELDECTCDQTKRNGWKANLFGRKEKKKKIAKLCEPFPWYCKPPHSSLRAFYIRFMNFLIDEFLLLVGVVVFLDVPISFFTGEFDEMGTLGPKPFFQRWILPGLVLQLLVNPKMASTSKLLRDLFHFIFDVGPVRFWRWAIAVFYPLFIVVFEILERIWIRLVADQNHKTVFTEARATVMTRDRELAQSVAFLTKTKLE